MPLFVETGRFEINHRRRPGAGLIVVPRLSTNEVHGIFLVVAVDITNVENGMAARESVKILSDSYYAAPADWGAKHALNESFCAVNETLCSGIKSGQAVALSALVLRRRRWSLGHAGNNRVWSRSGGETDHFRDARAGRDSDSR